MAHALSPSSTTMEQDARHIHEDKPVSPGNVAIGVVIGRTSEFFDFFVYGIASVLVFPRLIFPFAPDPVTGTLYAFAFFSLAFLARPVGSVAFMWVDRTYGRGTKLTLALLILGGSTASMAFLPGYETIGVWAPILLAVFRLGQGFALGGAWDGLASLLAINAPPNRRGFYAMVPQLGAPVGFALASALFGYFVVSLSTADFLDYGWRIRSSVPSRSTSSRSSRGCGSSPRPNSARRWKAMNWKHSLCSGSFRSMGSTSFSALSCRLRALPCSTLSPSSR